MANILVVEDNAANMKLAVFLLELLDLPAQLTQFRLLRRLRGSNVPDADLVAVLLLPGMQQVFRDAQARANLLDGVFTSRQDQAHCLALELLRVLLSTLLGGHAGGLSGRVLPFLSVHQTGVISRRGSHSPPMLEEVDTRRG